MINHPNRSAYYRLIAKLQSISADGDYAPDCRRLARDEYQRMMVATRLDGRVKSAASYLNLSASRAEAEAWEQRDRDEMEHARREAMARARASAEQFISSWGL